VKRLGSFGPWYERTLAAMTNLQRLGSGPLGRAPSAGAVSGMWAAGKSTGNADDRARAPPPPLDRHSLAQALLPDPIHVAPHTGAQSSPEHPKRQSWIRLTCTQAACRITRHVIHIAVPEQQPAEASSAWIRHAALVPRQA
jgi:hypothetical protein